MERSLPMKVKSIVPLALALILTLTTATWLRAAEFHVNTADDLKTALTMSQDNYEDDIIYLAEGVYIGHFTFSTTQTKSLTLMAEEGLTADQVILDGNDTGRVFNLGAGNNEVDFTLERLTLQRGRLYSSGNGAALYINTDGNVQIRKSVFKDSTVDSQSGGGIHLYKANSFEFSENSVMNNSAGNSGGGIFISSVTTIFINENSIVNNASFNGGGIHIYIASGSPQIDIKKNIVSNNTYSGRGGGIFLNSWGSARIEYNLISNNTSSNANSDGGGGYLGGNSIAITHNIFSENTCHREGGGLFVETSSACNINSNTIYANTGGTGGGLCIPSASAGPTRLYNNIIWGNLAESGADIFSDSIHGDNRLHHNVFSDMSGTWGSESDNQNVNPSFLSLGTGDYHLAPGSPCINAGDNNAYAIREIDLDGNPRIMDQVVDIGAYEFFSGYHPADADQDWSLALGEVDAYVAAWRSGAPWQTGPSPIPIEFVTRATYLKESGGTYHHAGGTLPLGWASGNP